MSKLVLLADFFPKEYVTMDPEAAGMLAELGEDIQTVVVDDPMIRKAKKPMSVIRDFETKGIGDVVPDEAVLEAVADADYLLVHWSAVNRAVIDAAPKLKFIGSLRSGWENVDRAYAESRGITVRNCPGRLADSVADLTVAFMLERNKALLRRDLVSGGGAWPSSGLYQGHVHRPLCMLTVGLVGYGYIAQTVARRLHGFGCQIQAFDPYTPDAAFEQYGVKRVDLDTLLATSDIVSLHARVTEATKGMIGREQLARMKKESIFINTARADLVDEEALIETLREGRIQYAAMDVFAKEPIPEDYALLKLDNVLLTPHIGGNFPGMVQLSLRKILEALKAYLGS